MGHHMYDIMLLMISGVEAMNTIREGFHPVDETLH